MSVEQAPQHRSSLDTGIPTIRHALTLLRAAQYLVRHTLIGAIRLVAVADEYHLADAWMRLQEARGLRDGDPCRRLQRIAVDAGADRREGDRLQPMPRGQCEAVAV